MTDHILFEDLSAYVDSELDAADRGRVEDHLATCGRCRDELASLSWSVAVTHAMPLPPVPEGMNFHIPAANHASRAASTGAPEERSGGALGRMAGWLGFGGPSALSPWAYASVSLAAAVAAVYVGAAGSGASQGSPVALEAARSRAGAVEEQPEGASDEDASPGAALPGAPLIGAGDAGGEDPMEEAVAATATALARPVRPDPAGTMTAIASLLYAQGPPEAPRTGGMEAPTAEHTATASATAPPLPSPAAELVQPLAPEGPAPAPGGTTGLLAAALAFLALLTGAAAVTGFQARS